jgi:hypothetical protein
MATKYLSANAALSAAVWWTTSGGSTTTTAPGVGDDADLNGHTLTVDQTFTCDNIVGSGTLAISGSRTINANLGNTGSAWACTLGAVTLTVNGNIVGCSVTASRITLGGSTSTLNVTGNVTGGTGSNTYTLFNSGGTISITGDVTPTASFTHGVFNQGTLTVTGTVYGFGNGHGIFQNVNTPIVINGNVSGGDALTYSNGSVTLNGNVTGGSAGTIRISGGTLTINGGTITAGTATAGHGIAFAGGTMTMTGVITTVGAFQNGLPQNAAYGILLTGGAITFTGNLIEGNTTPVSRSAGTFSYTPTTGQSAIIGGTTLTAGSGSTFMGRGVLTGGRL